MTLVTQAPRLRSFTLALIQLGRIGSKKCDNLNHARVMIMKAAEKKPDVIVLPVCHIQHPIERSKHVKL